MNSFNYERIHILQPRISAVKRKTAFFRTDYTSDPAKQALFTLLTKWKNFSPPDSQIVFNIQKVGTR